jgi:ectoine hydroxylase-related dioxygenase (phytanoyl-CoA dioxygenase family)
MSEKITNNQIKFYNKYGYLIVKNVLNNKEVNNINKILKSLEKQQPVARGVTEPGIKKSLIHSIHKNKDFIEKIEKKNWFQSFSAKLLKSNEVTVWNAKANLKKRWHGTAEYYHQDYIYWKELGFKSSQLLNCMIFLDDHSHVNAGLWVFPSSHEKMNSHKPFLNINSLHKYFIEPELLDKISKKNKPISIKAKKGSCLFFHCKLIHGSSHNISSNDRKVLLCDVSSKKHFETANIEKIKTFNRKERIIFEKNELLKRLRAIS